MGNNKCYNQKIIKFKEDFKEMGKEKNQKDEINKKLEQWLRNNVPDDEDERKVLLDWASLCERAIREELNIAIKNPEAYLAIYCGIFDAILDRLTKERTTHSHFSINVAGVVEIGYDDSTNDDETEKMGNFAPYIYDIDGPKFEIGKKEIDALEDSTAMTADELSSIEKCTAWVSAHVLKQKKALNDIATTAIKYLAEAVDIHLGNPVVVFPIFAICHQQLREYIKVIQKESGNSSEKMDICGNFTIYAHLVDDGVVAVEYKPDPSHKLATKSDGTATATHEDE